MEQTAPVVSQVWVILISIGSAALFFILFRRFVLWYFKLDRLDEIAKALKELVIRSGGKVE